MAAVYNLFYDGLPKEIQDHIYNYDSTYNDMFSKALFRNEIQFINKLRKSYDLPSFIVQCPSDKTGESIELLTRKIQSRLTEETIYYPYHFTVSNTDGIAFENDNSIRKLQLYHRSFPVPLELLPSNGFYKNYKLGDPDTLTELPYNELLNRYKEVSRRFPSFRWPFYEASGYFDHTHDLVLWPKMCLFQVIFRNDWTFGEIQRTMKCFKEEGFGVMFIDDYESCINSLRGLHERPMYVL